jgi:hypothetical protein
MAITIQRKTGLMGSGVKMKIYVNNEHVESVREGEEVQIELPKSQTTLRVSQLGMKSNEIRVAKGEILKITTKNWIDMSLIFLILVLPILNLFLPWTYRIIFSFTFSVIFIGCYFFLESFHIEEGE